MDSPMTMTTLRPALKVSYGQRVRSQANRKVTGLNTTLQVARRFRREPIPTRGPRDRSTPLFRRS